MGKKPQWSEHNWQLFLVNHTDFGTSAQMASELQEEHHQFADMYEKGASKP